MSKAAVYVRILGHRYLLVALVIHIYKNFLYSINNKKGYVFSLYRTPSQTSDEFDSFIKNLEKFIVNIYSWKADFLLLIGGFNAKSYSWPINGITTPKAAQIDSQCGITLRLISLIKLIAQSRTVMPSLLLGKNVHQQECCYTRYIKLYKLFQIEIPWTPR